MENSREELYNLCIVQGLTYKQIAEILQIKYKQVEYWIKKFKICRNSELQIPKEKISLEDPIFCYFLGLWIADGWINKKQNVVGLALKHDKVILERIGAYLNPHIKIREYLKPGSAEPVYQMHLAKSEHLLDFLAEHKLDRSDKTFTATLPKPKNPQCTKMLLRGLIDGDGNVRDGFRLFTCSVALKNTLVEIIQDLFNYEMTVTETKTKKSFGFTISSGVNFWPNLIAIYQDFEDYRIERKKESIRRKVYEIVHSHKMINYGSWDLIP